MLFLEVPDWFPQTVNASVLSSTSVHVQWEMVPFISQNGIIIYYEVLLEPNVAKYTSSLNITIENLNEDFVYNVTVTAFTIIGSGPPSFPSVSVRTLEDQPTKLPSLTEIAYPLRDTMRIDISRVM